MARPRKTGLDYFPKDVDTWDNFRIMDLVNEYGPLGYCVYDIVRDEIYKNGYYLEVPLDKVAALVVRKIGNRWVKDKNLVLQVIQYCADIGLLHNALLTQSVITSVGIQRRYSEVTVRNKVDTSKYWLLEKNNYQEALESASKNPVSVTKTRVSAAKTPINAAEIPQKESEVNEIKVNKSKVKQSSTDGELLYDILLSFNSVCVSLDPVKSLGDYSKRMLLQLMAQKSDIDFEKLFERVERSDFLTGRNGRWSKGGNKASFEWIIRPDNVNKILSGKYDNKEPSKNTEDDGGSYDDPF